MQPSEHWHTASDGKRLFYRRFLPDGEVKAVVQVVHGISEHSARYAPLAEVLTAAGYAVYVDDHRGHGKTGQESDELGWFDGGTARVKADLAELMALAKAAHPGLPFGLLGHSMGSFFVQALMQSHGGELQAAVLSASIGKPQPIALAGLLVARLEILRQGKRGKSPVIRALSFDAFNKPFRASGPTPFEWISRDRAEVDKYAADPLCGFDPSNEAWLQVLELIFANARPEARARIPKSLPVYVFSGREDMANERTRRLSPLVDALRGAGLTDVTYRVYEGARHETLNETNRAEVHRDLLAWLEPRLARR